MPVHWLFVCGLLVVLGQWGDAGQGSDALRASPPRFDRAPAPQSPPNSDEEMRQALAAAARTRAGGLSSAEQQDLAALYGTAEGVPVWVDRWGRPTDRARIGLALLERAADEGLDPADYDVVDLAARAAGIGQATAASASAAAFDVAMSAAVLRYFRHLHLGRVDPRSLGLQIDVPSDGHDLAAVLRDAVDRDRLREAAAELAPPLAQYRALRGMLVRYRALAVQTAGEAPPMFAETLRPGEAFADLAALRRLLVTVGDLPPDTPLAASGIYAETIAAGVRRFQARHGLEDDGVIGRATAAALRVPLAWRVRQIELALERLRWLPDLSGGRLVAVNIPMFRMWAWDSVPSDDPPALSMAVIVGRALNTRTPVFADRMEYVVFRPYWNVPSSILRNEMIPAIRRDPGYLARQDLEIVRGQADSSPVLDPTPEHIAELGRGGVRIRQRPGPANALGLVKFMFPNQNDVYMHSTPAPQLFRQSRRDFSHGCIRVEDPVALAEWVLKHDDPQWTRDRVVSALNGAPNQRVNLPRPIQVVIFYTTAVVTPEDGAAHFAEDVYGQDERLDKAL